MISRTEVTRSSQTGKLQAYQKADEKGKKIWITHFDDRTCALCKRMDGQEVDINEDFTDIDGWTGKIALRHVRCRCSFSVRPADE